MGLHARALHTDRKAEHTEAGPRETQLIRQLISPFKVFQAIKSTSDENSITHSNKKTFYVN